MNFCKFIDYWKENENGETEKILIMEDLVL